MHGQCNPLETLVQTSTDKAMRTPRHLPKRNNAVREFRKMKLGIKDLDEWFEKSLSKHLEAIETQYD